MRKFHFVCQVSVRFARKEVAASSDASATAEEALSSVQTVIAFGGQAQENERYQQHLRTAKRANIMRSIWSAISNGLLWFFVFACYALSFWYGIGLIIRDRNLAEDNRYYTPGNVVAVSIDYIALFLKLYKIFNIQLKRFCEEKTKDYR